MGHGSTLSLSLFLDQFEPLYFHFSFLQFLHMGLQPQLKLSFLLF